jgi:hypothetical protein
MTAPLRPPTPRPLVVSCGLGALGALLLLVGLVTGAEALSLAGVAVGTLSLGAALFWRSDLITAWRADRPARQKGAGSARRPGGPRTPG